MALRPIFEVCAWEKVFEGGGMVEGTVVATRGSVGGSQGHAGGGII